MPDLRAISIWFGLLTLMGCATSSYRIINKTSNQVEINVTPDRVLIECEWLYDSDNEGQYGFMIHILDEEKTVLTAIQGNRLDKEGCSEWRKKITKIVQHGKNIYIAGMGDLENERIKDKTTYNFPSGTFYRNGRVLQFRFIANEQGMCFSSQTKDEKPCPRDEFPIK